MNTKDFVKLIVNDRDKRLIKAYKDGLQIIELESKFGITKTRIYQILAEHNVKVDRKNLCK
jgi:Mor family transcriptional regulator